MKPRTKQYNIRLTTKEDMLLDELYLYEMSKTEKLISRSKFFKQQLLKLCKKLLT